MAPSFPRTIRIHSQLRSLSPSPERPEPIIWPARGSVQHSWVQRSPSRCSQQPVRKAGRSAVEAMVAAAASSKLIIERLPRLVISTDWPAVRSRLAAQPGQSKRAAAEQSAALPTISQRIIAGGFSGFAGLDIFRPDPDRQSVGPLVTIGVLAERVFDIVRRHL